MCAIDVGHKVNVGADSEWLEGLGDHEGAKVRAANANVHHISNGLACVALPLTRDNLQNTKITEIQ